MLVASAAQRARVLQAKRKQVGTAASCALAARPAPHPAPCHAVSSCSACTPADSPKPALPPCTPTCCNPFPCSPHVSRTNPRVAQDALTTPALLLQRKKELQQLLQQTGLQTQARQAVRAAAQARLQKLAGSQPAVDAALACQQRLAAEAGVKRGPTGQAAAGPAVQPPAEQGSALLQESVTVSGPQAPANLCTVVVGREGLLAHQPTSADAKGPAMLCADAVSRQQRAAGSGSFPAGPDTSSAAWRVAAAAHVMGVERRMLEQLAHQMGL